MRYTPGELERLSMSFDTTMKNLEDEIMTDIVRRIKINGELTRSADWQIYRLHELGVSKRVIRKKIQDLTGLSYREVSTLYKQAIQKGYAEDEKIYKYKGKPYIPFNENKYLQQLILATALQTNNVMNNITQSLGFAVKNTDNTTKFLPIAEYYQRTLDNAMLGITTGAFDYTTVLNRTVAELTNSGLRTVDYASGWSNRVEVATRRAVMTGFNQIVAKVNDDNAEKLGTEYFEVSWHSGARPTHQVWQGRVYTKEQLETVCGLGEVTGLCGANCYHSYYPFFPGISERIYTDEQLEEMNRQENIPVEYNGKQYTKYEALQRQRRLETTMRSQRQKIKLLQEGGASEEDVITTRARYRVTSAEYTRFSKAMNLPQQRERVTIDGLGNIGAGKYKTYKIDYMSNSYRPTFVESKPISFLRGTEEEKIQVKKVNNSKFDMVTDVDNTRRNKAVRLAERSLTAIQKELPKDFKMPKIAVVDFDRHKISSNAIGGYDRNTGILYLNSKYNTPEKIIDYVTQTKGMFANNTEYAPFMHELGHKYYYDKINSIAKSQNIGYNKAKDIIDGRIYDYVHDNIPYGLTKSISEYANDGYRKHSYTEIVAECFSVHHTNTYAKDIINLLNEVI